jgi:O-acetyl-ADP-ribose deacetylase (regulator of RNase III)
MVNDRARKWGGGIARRSAQKFPQAELEFAAWLSRQPPGERLGKVHFSSAIDGVVIASLVAQEGFGKSNLPRIRYGALEACLMLVATYAQKHGFSVHMPRIGTGAAGGTWEAVEEIIHQYLVAFGLLVTVYDIPPKRQQLRLFD